MCTYLLNSAVTDGFSPIFIDLDVGQGVISTCGVLAAVDINQYITLDVCSPLSCTVS